jgi:hypothetical protein
LAAVSDVCSYLAASSLGNAVLRSQVPSYKFSKSAADAAAVLCVISSVAADLQHQSTSLACQQEVPLQILAVHSLLQVTAVGVVGARSGCPARCWQLTTLTRSTGEAPVPLRVPTLRPAHSVTDMVVRALVHLLAQALTHSVMALVSAAAAACCQLYCQYLA